jgi:ABC-type branched-subunit amino acid transport system substrate-binding protein
MQRQWVASLALVSAMALASGMAQAEKKYGPGASDTEIKIGSTMPYSGPASAYGTIGKAEAAYIKMINEQGGVNGRKINLISLDDGYSPPKTVEQTRALVEQENVLFTFQGLGTPTQVAVHKYMNQKQVPQLFVATGATFWADPEHFPWTMGWQPNYQTEGHIYARYVLQNKPDAKIAILYQNDDSGRDYVKGFKDGLDDAGRKKIVSEVSYEVTDPTIDSQIVTLKGAGANVFFNDTTPKFAAQAIRKVADVGWQPMHILMSVSASVAAVFQPAGLDKSTGIITAAYLKDPTDPQWANEKDFQDWSAFMKKYYPEGNTADSFNGYGYAVAYTLVEVLKQCGDDLTRENIMKQAANIKPMKVPMLLPGITLSTSPTNFSPLRQMHLQRFDGKTWILFGDVIGG